MTERRYDYLIIGNSAAGVTAAEHIRAYDEVGSVLIVSRESYAAYGRPLISYLLEGKTTEDKIGYKDPGFYEDNRIDTLLGIDFEAVELDAEAHRAILANGDRIEYGKCLIATGSIPFIPPLTGLEGKTNIHTFLTLDDAKGVWQAAREATQVARSEGRPSRAIVIGAGLIGLKAAEAVSYHIDEVVVLELAPRILPAVLDQEGATLLQGLLAKHGLDCRPGVTAEELIGADSTITSVKLTDGDTLDCDMVIAAVGVRPNTELATRAGAKLGRGLVCSPTLETNLPDVFAAGDVTQVTNILDGSQLPLALWPNAVRQGKIAGLHMAGAPDAPPFEGNFAVNAVDFYDISLLTSGIINPPEDAGYETVQSIDGDAYARFITKDDRLMGYILLNRPSNAGIYTTIIEQRIPLSTLEGDLFGESPVNLDFPQTVRWERLHTFYPADLDERGWREQS